ncbi:MAG: hypothetical protein ABR964_09150 [Tepidisphaeraceae bacterium]|jgi:DNA-binding beta-propeller fold protein YncE
MSSANGNGSAPCLEALEARRLLSASFLSHLSATPTVTGNTVPSNGDVNPYGVAFVPQNVAKGGKLHAGDVLVSNFNNSSNLQGTGTTIVEINPKTGAQSVFFQGKGELGLTTALGVLPQGFVLVGNVPTPDGQNVDGPGSLLILDKNGHIVKTLKSAKLLDGPWDLTIDDDGPIAKVFVSNVLDGTVTRLDLAVPSKGDDVDLLSATRIASGYTFRTDPAALVVGPTGLAFDEKTDKLYVASTGDNAIYAIANAENSGPHGGTGKLIFSNQHLRGPLALAFAPNGDLLTANGDAVNADPNNLQNSEIVEFTTTGKFVNEFQIASDPGGAFGLAVQTNGDDVTFAAVNDITNQLDIWKFDI